MTDAAMLCKWLEDRGYRLELEGYRRLLDRGYAGFLHSNLARVMHTLPTVFTQYVQACEQIFEQDPNLCGHPEWHPAVMSKPAPGSVRLGYAIWLHNGSPFPW